MLLLPSRAKPTLRQRPLGLVRRNRSAGTPAGATPGESNMRVGLIIYGSLDTLSGGYLYDRKLVDYLRETGDTVEIISIPWRNYAQHLGDNLSHDLYRRLRRAPIDVLLQDELNHPSLFALNRRLRGKVRYPVFSIVHHLRSYEAHPVLVKGLYRWIERQYLASVDGFIFNSQTTRQAVCDTLRVDRVAPPRSIVACPAGDRFAPVLTVTVDLIKQRAHEAGSLRLVFVGNLIPRKGLHILLEALTRLPAGTWQLTAIGNLNADGRYTQRIRRQIAEQHLQHVHLVGAVPDDDLARTLAAGHVLVVPSDYEGFGIVYLEGMGFGLPAIATTSGAAHEIITDGENGFLISPNDPRVLAGRLEILQSDRMKLERMSRAAQERFYQQPPWRESMARIREALVEWTP